LPKTHGIKIIDFGGTISDDEYHSSLITTR